MPLSIGTISSYLSPSADRQVRLEPAGVAADVPAAVEPVEAARQALAEPLDYPPLAQATVPGDHVAIAVVADVPCAADVVRGSIDAFVCAGVERDAICVVSANPRFNRLLRDRLDSGSAEGVRFVVHDPLDPYELCPVGMTERNEPLLVNRTLYDADIVLPIGCARLDGRGVYGSLFPWFSSVDSIRRYREPAQRQRDAQPDAARRETDEAGWLLGAPLVMQVVPGRDGAVASVLAGEPGAAARQGQQLCHRHWSFRAARRANLVIATLGGDAEVQSWDDIGRALAAAEQLVEDDGAVAICSDFHSPPGKSLDRLVDCTDLAAAEHKLFHERRRDSWPAWHLARALQRGPVYLLSRLDAETVEELGVAPIADLEELARLVSRQESYVVLGDAHYAVASVAGEGGAQS